MASHFYAFISRMKYINRWSLMRNTRNENLSEHALEVAILAHALCVIGNTYFEKQLNADRAALLAIYHDANEIITGDMPTPIKYFNPQISKAYKDVETISKEKLLTLLPSEMQATYEAILFDDTHELMQYVKWADKLSAYVKCIEEGKAGNTEFNKAAQSIRKILEDICAPEVQFFMKEFLPSYGLSVDEQDGSL